MLMYAKAGEPQSLGYILQFLQSFTVWADREEPAACQVAPRGCSVPALKETTATPEVPWLGTLRSFFCLFVSGACIATSLKEKLLPRTHSFTSEPGGRSCLNLGGSWTTEVLRRNEVGREVGRCFHVRTETCAAHQAGAPGDRM